MDISKLNLPPIAAKFCRMACIETVEELIKITEPQLSKYRALGKPSIPAITAALKRHGLELGMKSRDEYLREAEELESQVTVMRKEAKRLRRLAAKVAKLSS